MSIQTNVVVGQRLQSSSRDSVGTLFRTKGWAGGVSLVMYYYYNQIQTDYTRQCYGLHFSCLFAISFFPIYVYFFPLCSPLKTERKENDSVKTCSTLNISLYIMF